VSEKTGKERRTDVDECLDEMRASAAAIERYIDGLSEERFTQEEMRQDAVVRRLEMIGEAADRIMKADPEYAKNLPGIALVEAKRMRNFVIHGYDQVNISVVWHTARRDIPSLRAAIEKVLSSRRLKS